MTRINQAGIGFPTDGGMATTRTTATTQDIATRAAEQADALAYLHRTGNADLAVILGLAAAAPRREPSPAIRKRRYETRRCLVCETEYRPTRAEQITCGRSCGRKHAHRSQTKGSRPC